MEQEYCIIYGYNDVDPGPFIVGVTKDQEMINGFREEHYHFCKGGEIVKDGFYNNLAADYEIDYTGGHYLTPIMKSKFVEYLISQYNQLFMLYDNLERDMDNLIFSDDERDVLDEGLGLLKDHLDSLVYEMNIATPYDFDESSVVEDSVYGAILNVPLCLEKFLSTYQPEAGLY